MHHFGWYISSWYVHFSLLFLWHRNAYPRVSFVGALQQALTNKEGSHMSEEKDELVSNIMLLAAYVQRLDHREGDAAQVAKSIETLSAELLAVHARLSESDELPVGGYVLPNVADIITGDLAVVKKELCQVVGDIDKAINAGRKAKG